jgi:hypothetical protein
MKKRIFVFCFFSFLFGSCIKEESYCGVGDPINDIGWLKDRVKSNPTNIFIYKVIYNSTNGFYIEDNTLNVGEQTFNSCDNKVIYHSAGGVVGVSTFPQNFELNLQYKEKIYPR